MLSYTDFLSQLKQIELREEKLKKDIENVRKKKIDLKLKRLKSREEELKKKERET